MKTEKVEAILSAPTVTLKELLNKPELLVGKEGFWFFTDYTFPNPAGPVVRKMRLDKKRRWIISDIDTGDDYEEFQGAMSYKDSELFLYPHLAWMLEGDSIEGHLY